MINEGERLYESCTSSRIRRRYSKGDSRKEGIYIVPMHVTFDGETKDDGTFPASNIIDYLKRI